MIRLYTPTIEVGQSMKLLKGHYLQRVMRARIGDSIAIFNEHDGEWHAKIMQFDRQAVVLEAQTCVKPAIHDTLALTLIIPLIKHQRFDWLMEKATELGVTHIFPVTTERTVSKAINADRINAILIEAAEQCERLSVPILAPLQPLIKCLQEWSNVEKIHVAVERAESVHYVTQLTLKDNCTIMVGPEGGWSPHELDVFTRYAFINPVSIGPTILRTETAALAMLAAKHLLA